MLVKNIQATSSLLMQLQEREITISIDDFGTGYSSLSYLHNLPIDTLKIDRSFVSRTKNEPNDVSIAETIVSLGQSLGLEVVAEGIEGPEQVAWLQQVGCELGQGYWFSRPIPPEEVAILLRDNSKKSN